MLDTDLEVWEHVQATNLRSVFLCCKHGIPHLLERGGGSVINTASFVAVLGSATSQIAYTASKGGVLALSRELGVEFAQRGIRVNALCPGPIDTPLLRELYAADPVQAARRMVHVPMGRFGRAEEIANAVLFLASDESSYVNATDFPGRRRAQRGLHHPGLSRRVRRPGRRSAGRRPKADARAARRAQPGSGTGSRRGGSDGSTRSSRAGRVGQPPVPAPEQRHDGGHEQRADDGRVEQDPGGQAGGEHLDVGLRARRPSRRRPGTGSARRW